MLIKDQSNTQSVNRDHMSINQRLSLAQSAVLCLDALVQYFNKLSSDLERFRSLDSTKDKWEEPLMTTLKKITGISAAISACLNKKRIMGSILDPLVLSFNGVQEFSKLLGSLFLLSGSIYKVLKGKCLPHLSVTFSVSKYNSIIYYHFM
jgi:hypothetical protein